MAESFFDRLRSAGESSYSSPKEKNKPSAVLSDEYRSFVDELPGDVQNEVDRYLNIFKNDPTPVIQFLDEYKKDGYSDYFDRSVFSLRDIADKDDLNRFSDFKYLGGNQYDAMYRQDAAGDIARTKIKESKLFQTFAGPTHGLYTGVRGTAELVGALSDLYLDTETLDNIQKVLPEININDIYGPDAGGIAKFTSLLTQYGTGFAVAQKVAKKLFGNVAKTKLANKAAKKAAQTKAGQVGLNLAKYGGYWVLPVACSRYSCISNRTTIYWRYIW